MADNETINVIKSIGRINYIEPNDLVKYSGIISGKHNNGDNIYWNPEDLSIDVDLQVLVPDRTHRTIIKDNTSFETFISASKDSVFKSFLGGNEISVGNKTGKEYLTTEATDISFQTYDKDGVGKKECLGINSIDITFDAHFYPQVTMRFTDVRASSLFQPAEKEYTEDLNGKKIPNKQINFFRALFHFPYPRFLLSIKGFYGNRVTFILAVNNFTSSFVPSTGNFDVTVTFIGYMYGLYTEIPMNYLIVAPYIDPINGNGDDIDVYTYGKYWSERINEGGPYHYIEANGASGSQIQTYLEFVKNYISIADKIQHPDELGEVIKDIAKLQNQIQDIKDILNLAYALVKSPDDKSEAQNKLDNIVNQYNGKLEKYQQRYNSLPNSQTIELTPNTQIQSNLVDEIEKEYSSLVRTREETIEENSNELTKIYSELLGFKPNVENIYRMAFAHLDCFLGQVYQAIEGDDTRQKLKRNIELDFSKTDVNGADSNTILPPFAGFFNTEHNRNVFKYPPKIDNRLLELPEVQLVEKLINAINTCKKNVEDITKEIQDREKAEQAEQNNDLKFQPSCPWDVMYLDENPYKSIKTKNKSPQDAAKEIYYFLLCRVTYVMLNLSIVREGSENTDDYDLAFYKTNNDIKPLIKNEIDLLKKAGVANNVDFKHFFDKDDAIATIKKFIKGNDNLIFRSVITKAIEEKGTMVDLSKLPHGFNSIYDSESQNETKPTFVITDNGKYGKAMTCFAVQGDKYTALQDTFTYRDISNKFSTRLYPKKPLENFPNNQKLTADDVEESNYDNIVKDAKDKPYYYFIPWITGNYRYGYNSHNVQVETGNKNLFKDEGIDGLPIDIEEDENCKAMLFLASLVNSWSNAMWLRKSKDGVGLKTDRILKMPYILLLYYGAMTYRWEYMEQNHTLLEKPINGFFTQDNINKFKTCFLNIGGNSTLYTTSPVDMEIQEYYKEGFFQDAKKKFLAWVESDWKDIYSAIKDEVNNNKLKSITESGTTSYYFEPNSYASSEIVNLYVKDVYTIFNLQKEIKIDDWAEDVDLFEQMSADLKDAFQTNDVTEYKPNTGAYEEAKAIDELKLSTYFTLKTLYDKWLATYDTNRFKLNTPEEDYRIRKERYVEQKPSSTELSEFNNFMFIDTYYNDIGQDFIINPETLYHRVNEFITSGTHQSFYEFINEIAQDNNLLFLAMPVFNNLYNPTGVKEIFTPHPTEQDNARGIGNTYVVMYTNNVSSFLDENSTSEYYPTDGFDIADTNGEYRGSSLEALKFFGRNENSINYNVAAFGVTYGRQNQSYFKNVNINMENPVVTDYSIANQLKLAQGGAHGDVDYPMGVGQNIYNIYANRSYTCSVDMMGCANIMPLMYFQLNNLPMFKGAYMITNVEHHITPGNMQTTFKGVRVSKNGLPSTNLAFNMITLLDKITSYGYGSGSTSSLSSSPTSSDTYIPNAGNGNKFDYNDGTFSDGVFYPTVASRLSVNATNKDKEFDVEKAIRAMNTIVSPKQEKLGQKLTCISNKQPGTTGECAWAVRRFVDAGYGNNNSPTWSGLNGFFCYQPLITNYGWEIIKHINFAEFPECTNNSLKQDKFIKETSGKLEYGDIVLLQYPKHGHISMVAKGKDNTKFLVSDYNQKNYFTHSDKNKNENNIVCVLVLRAPKRTNYDQVPTWTGSQFE